MAAAFFLAIMYMWQSPVQTGRWSGWAYITLFLFQVTFGLFLSFPTSYKSDPHAIATGCFIFFASVHLLIEISHGIKNRLATTALVIALIGVAGVVFVLAFGSTYDIAEWWQYSFWFCECVGLTGMAWYTPLLILSGEQGGSELKRTEE
jgi:hypothetical protein